MDLFHVLFYVPTFNLLMFFTGLFGNIGWAIIIIAAISKLLTYPLTKGQLEQAEKNKDFQGAIKAVQKQYKFNKEKQTQELAKIQAKALPGQLKGCFSIIIFIFLFIQIRGTIVDLVNKGYHSYNQVAYSESMKKKEDFISYDYGQDLIEGRHDFTIEVTTSGGITLKKNFSFEVYSNVNERMEQIKVEELNKTDNTRIEERIAHQKQIDDERKADISIYNEKLSTNDKSIALKSFLIFPLESVNRTIIDKKEGKFDFYLRAPSNETFLAEKTKITFDGVDVTGSANINQGEALNLEFLGMNLAKVGADFDLASVMIVLPYALISLFSAFTQYLVTKVYSGTAIQTNTVVEEKSKNDQKQNKDVGKKKKDQPAEDVSMSDAMLESTKTMNKILPIMTFVISMGYFGGASFLPTGVTLFWTAQNLFVIIQQLSMHPRQNLVKLQTKFNHLLKK